MSDKQVSRQGRHTSGRRYEKERFTTRRRAAFRVKTFETGRQRKHRLNTPSALPFLKMFLSISTPYPIPPPPPPFFFKYYILDNRYVTDQMTIQCNSLCRSVFPPALSSYSALSLSLSLSSQPQHLCCLCSCRSLSVYLRPCCLPSFVSLCFFLLSPTPSRLSFPYDCWLSVFLSNPLFPLPKHSTLPSTQ